MYPAHIKRIAANQQGGLGFVAIFVCFAIIFLIPFFWDVGSVYYARRFASTGSDAASLAAAQEYARQLQHVPDFNGIWYGRCELGEFTPQQVLARYLLEPAFMASPYIGYGYAQDYANRNRNQLTQYQSRTEYGGRQVEGVPIPWIIVYVETNKDVFTAYGPLYGREFKAPNQALAVAYLHDWTMTEHPCPGGEVTYDFTFEWKITLDKARGR